MNDTDVTVTPREYVGRMEGGWNPWHELRRREHIVFALGSLPALTGGAIYWPRGDRAAIVLDRSLGRAERRAALAHELIHDERGGGFSEDSPSTWAVVAARNERQVDDEVARRLVPAEALQQLVDERVELGMAVDAWTVGEEFEVPEPVAERALALLGKQTKEGWQ